MNKLDLKKYFKIVLLVFIIIFIIFCFFENKNIKENDNAISFNRNSGFYNDTISIKLNKNIDLPIGTKIYYTLDGNDPTDQSILYESPIILEKIDDETKVYPIKAITYYNGNYGEIYENTYIIDEDIDDIKLPVFSITSDSDNLYNPETGIMIRKNVLYREEEWLRDARITYFNNNGDLIFDKTGKIGISGHSSAGKDVKSFKLIANDNDNFNLNLYEEDTIKDYSLINNYNSIRIHTGTDYYRSNLRSAIISRLADQSNFDGYSTTQRVLVFLNGNFYGLLDLQQNYSSSFLAKKYALEDSSKIEKYKGNETQVFEDAKLTSYFEKDLNNKDNRDELEQYVDMDNYLLYCAIQIASDNTDWPQNNFELWRYTGDINEDNKYSDNRYRFLIYDNDVIFFSEVFNMYTSGNALENILNNQYAAKDSLLKNVLSSKYYRDKFIMILEDLLNTSFKKENVLNIVDEEYELIRKSYKKYFDNDMQKTFKKYINSTYDFLDNYNEILNQRLKNNFNFKDTHKINVKSNEGIQINFSNQELYQNQSYQNDYFNDVDLVYTYKIYPGYKFSYWLVNNEKVYDDVLIINEKYKNINEINIEAIAEYQENDNHLIISEVYAKGSSDWIKLTNISKETIIINNYYLSDNKKNLYKYQLPKILLEPSKSIVVNGNKNYYAIGDYICNFNISSQEKLYLSKNNNVVDSITIPRTSDIETFGRYDNSNTFKYYLNVNNKRKRI